MTFLPLLMNLQAQSAGASVPSDTTTYTPGTPSLATITNGTSAAPWNLSQGDSGGSAYTSQSPGTVLPTYTPGGAQFDGYPNLPVYPGTSSGTDGDSPYPSGVVGTPGPVGGYCGSGNNATESSGSPVRQPSGTYPLSPDYFPHVVRNSDGTLTGYFDWRPKDVDEALLVASSSDNGEEWTYDGEALEQNPGLCPTGDTNDDGEGHANIVTTGSSTYLYTLERAAGDNLGVGLLVHSLSSATESNPTNGLPATEETGIDPDDFASSAVTINTTAATINFSQPVGTGAEALVAGEFVDLTQTPTPTASDVITCTGVGTQSLTGCTTSLSGGISVASGDLIEQVIGTISSNLAATAGSAPNTGTIASGCASGSSTPGTNTTTDTGALPCTVPAGPNATTGDGGLEGFKLTVTNSNNETMFIADANTPNRYYIDGVAVYCVNANTYPTTKIENCTTGGGGPSNLTVHSGDPVTSDPIVPATAQQTNGLVAPDGIVGVLPSYPGAPADSTIVMYTEKVLNYYDVGATEASGSNAFSTIGTSGTGTLAFFPGASFPADIPSSGSFTVDLGDNTLASLTTPADVFVPVTCTGYTANAGSSGGLEYDKLTGCSVPSSISGTSYATSDTFSSNSLIAAPGAALVPGTTLTLTGEGSTTSSKKLFKNNEDLTLLRVAYTTDGINFSTTGLANSGIISGNGTESGSSYNDINNESQQTSPSNLNAYNTPGTQLATEMRYVGSTGAIITNPDGTYGMFLNGAWAADGDSDAFNQIFYSESSDGENWSVPVDIISTDYTFSASVTQDNELANSQDDPLGISAYYSGRAYGPTIVQNPNGTLTLLFAGYRSPKPIPTVGAVLGTNTSAQWTVGADDPALYRNILTDTLTTSTSPLVSTTTSLSSSADPTFSGQSVTYTATVAPVSPGTGSPTGTVTFTGNSGTLCTATLDNATPDTATCQTTYTSTGSDSVNATYNADSNYASSTTSSALSETIDASSTTLSAPGQLTAGQSITSPNGQYDLVMQTDGNLVEYGPSNAVVWAANTAGDSGAYTIMQGDGNLVVYTSSNAPVFASNTAGDSGAALNLADNGQLSVESGSGLPLWGPGLLGVGAVLFGGQSITSPNGQYGLVMQSDGNLVEYGPSNAVVWAASTAGDSGAYAIMQGDGNLVIYNASNAPVFASNTAGDTGSYLTLASSGQLSVESASGTALWQSP